MRRLILRNHQSPGDIVMLAAAVREMGAVPEAVGRVADHVHLLVGLMATHGVADVMRDLKRASSQWVHETVMERTFTWVVWGQTTVDMTWLAGHLHLRSAANASQQIRRHRQEPPKMSKALQRWILHSRNVA